MKTALPLLAALAIAAPAAAQPVAPPSPTTVESLLALPGAAGAFVAGEPGGVIHTASGFRCPRDSGSATLTAIGTDGDQAWCQYSDRRAPVARVTILPDAAAGAEPLSKAFCRDLPKALNLRVGAGLPGTNRMEGPVVPDQLGKVTVRGTQSPIWRCMWVKAPYQLTDIVIDASAVRPAGGWTVRIVNTPPATKRGEVASYSVYDMMRPLGLAMVVTRSAEEGEPRP
jgi:hypothetical protein